ncbi:hypothetical protein [Jannaschia marina]|uniref:hypothetical protein n=1 Tax=Jannaschia marina TaxID=2741674 RepID=UPI0015C82530|nr:hypothetical protein [Jannaschia marina]
MGIIRAWADITALGPEDALTEAEAALIAAARAGERCILGSGSRPEESTPDRRVRASILRFLFLGGCPDCRVEGPGVSLRGAWIEGEIDLSFQETRGASALIACHFDARLIARQAKLRTLDLSRSRLARLDLQGAHVTGDLFLRQVETRGEILLSGTRIGGQLDVEGAVLDGAKGTALMAQRLTVGEGLVWRGVRVLRGAVSLHSARVGVLADDARGWPGAEDLVLDGFVYDHIAGEADLSARLDWVEAGSFVGPRFHPQPFTQLARIFRQMGREGDARRVLRRRERRLRQQSRRRRLHRPDGTPREGGDRLLALFGVAWRWVWDALLRVTTGYGYQPFRSFAALGVLWLLAVTLAHFAWDAGDFAPNAAPVLVSDDWQSLALSETRPAQAWSAPGAPGQDWETFNRYAYAADLVIPIIDLNQTDAWAPSTSRGPWGRWLWGAGFVLNIAGWIVTALGAAAITGVIRRD